VTTSRSRRELEAAWHERVGRARSSYNQNVAVCAELLAEHLLESQPDTSFALTRALRREAEMLKEYMRVVTIYADLVVRGVVPEEEPDSF
jgi:hypothetical protein